MTVTSEIRRLVSKWTGEYQLTLDTVLYDMIERCRELKLRAVGSDRQLRTDFTLLLTAKTVHSLYSPQPSAHTSLRLSAARPFACSGLM